jgi:hypothetical protein
VIAQPQVRPGPLEGKPPHGLQLNRGRSVPLADTVPAVALRLRQLFRVEEILESARGERYRVSVTGYDYALLHSDTGAELLAFHWHRESSEGRLQLVTFPHLHIDSSVLSEQALTKLHIPTGRIAIEDVLRLAIRDFKARTLDRNWEKRLQETSTEFERARTRRLSGVPGQNPEV